MQDQALILASSSIYRRELLQRLLHDFTWVAPDCDEHPLIGETAREVALRLALSKARRVAEQHSDAVIIGSDQTARCGRKMLGKPVDLSHAADQLAWCSGRMVTFHTGLAVLNARTGSVHRTVVDTRVFFRELTSSQIQRYLQREPALDCAGSFKAEGLGISLFQSLRSEDPTALLGLPLIALTTCLVAEGFSLP